MRGLALVTLVAFTACVASAQPSYPPAKLTATLHAARTVVVPGETIELALAMNIPPPWHMYHPIVLEGFATEIDLKAPPGVTVAPWRFPAPELRSQGGIEYLGLEGKFTAITTITLDASIPVDSPLELRAAVSGLACIDTCVLVDAAATLSLPVALEGGAAANEEVFAAARAALGPELAEAPYLKGSRAVVSHSRVPVGGRGELAAIVRVEPGHHIQHRDPGNENFIATRLFVEKMDGLKIGEPVYPAAEVKNIPGFGIVRELSGEFAIRVPFEVTDPSFKTGPVRLRMLLQYQACRDSGQCYPPAMAAAMFEFEVVPRGETAVATNEAVFAAPLPVARGGSGRLPTGPPLPLWLVFVSAFVGGAILNVMPCVLPVISLKIFGFVQQAGESRGRILSLGLAYTAGVLASFAVVAAVMVNFGLAWGGIMQEPRYVMVLAAVVFAFSLSLLGVFELRLPGVIENAAAGASVGREGFGGAFFNGMMATALATPCVGPFLGTAVGVLIQLPPWAAGAGIMTVGMGLAAPYLLLSAVPGWLKYLPRPGKWMITFKQVMGFLLLATVLWLVFILHSLVDAIDLVALLCALLFIGFACWMIGRVTLSTSAAREWATWAAAIAVAVGGWFGSFAFFYKPVDHWRAWAPGLPEKLAAEGKTVFVDFTATWCLICQTNKALVLNVDPVHSKLQELGVELLKADFTKPSPEIFEALKKFDRPGVPLNVIYPAGRPDQEIVLPEVLTSDTVLQALEKAGASQSGSTIAAQRP